MPIPTTSRVYVDSNVFVYHLIYPKHREQKYCRRFLVEIEKGNLTGVINDYITSEVIGTANWLLAEANDREPTLQELQRVRERVEKEFDRLGLEIHDADKLATIPDLTPMFQRAGHVVLHSAAVRGTGGRWKSVGGPDGIHTSLAERSNVDYFATCDQGFERLSANITPAILKREYP